MRVLQLMSCRGWSSDAYWAARITAELERAGHSVTLVCRRGTEERVIERARQVGVQHIETLAFAGGVSPATDVSDLRGLLARLGGADVVHVHRGKEHWLAAVANRLSATPRPLVRTRHIVQPIRPHALNRWLYREATDLVVTVTEAIRRQYIAGGLAAAGQVVTLPGGVDVERFRPGLDGSQLRRSLGVGAEVPLIGLFGGFRVMKGHAVAVGAATRLCAEGRRFHLAFVGQGGMEPAIRRWVAEAGLGERVSVSGTAASAESVMAAFDAALYVPLESDGMSRVLFEYLALGKPVVASRVGVVPEVLADDDSALLVPAGESGPLARAVARILDDAPLRRRLGEAARRLVESRLSGARLARDLASLYAKMASAGGERRHR
ncbi:MAG: glycosyltransferase family 4 protein [Candidatus Rokubacteria bacterium]|nr:glycosyltransferase family 4 protein [Candidatus Rokubacteria bacterium]